MNNDIELLKQYMEQFRDVTISKDDMLNLLHEKCDDLLITTEIGIADDPEESYESWVSRMKKSHGEPSIYIAGRAETASQLKYVSSVVDGIIDSSTWFDLPYPLTDEEQSREVAQTCLNDIDSSNIFLLVHDVNARPLKGALIEFGYALARNEYEDMIVGVLSNDFSGISDTFVHLDCVHRHIPHHETHNTVNDNNIKESIQNLRDEFWMECERYQHCKV